MLDLLNGSRNGHAGQTQVIRTLLVDAAEAARLLGISPRTLWGQTAPRGPLPSVKIGRLERYSVGDLEKFITGQRQTM